MLIEEIKNMQKEGKSRQEIENSLKQRGLSSQQLDSAFSQIEIKEAVNPSEDSYPSSLPLPSSPTGMQPSIMSDEAPELEAPAPSSQGGYQAYPQPIYSDYSPQTQESYSYPQQSQQYYQEPSQSQSPYPSLGSDTITEIAEQVVAEKLSPMRKNIEKAIDQRNVSETRISQIDERLRRIEKIIDKLQLALLQRVGDYVSDVSDLKKEVIETQKSFKSLLDSSQEKPHSKK